MTVISLEELKVIQLNILEDVHRFCMDNCIRYSLAFGSLIGAIRHNGYIPWDDDIDIMMPRPDYDRFIHSFNGYFQHLTVDAPELNWDYYAPYGNVYDNRTLLLEGANGHRGLDLGIKIDVFPIDGVPDSEEEYELVRNRIWTLNGILYAKRLKIQIGKNLPFVRRKIKYILKSYSSIQKEIAGILASHPYSTSCYVDELAFNPYLKRQSRVLSAVFDSYIDVTFENRSFRADYDTFLTNVYGDYMTLPPKDKQTPHHGFTAFWK